MERENDEWYDFLFHRYMFLKEELDFFEHAVNGLDERHRSIITDLLDEDMTWDIMMERISCEPYDDWEIQKSSIEGTR